MPEETENEMNADGTASLPPRDPSDIQGDSGDQAQDLRFALEQEAIAAAGPWN